MSASKPATAPSASTQPVAEVAPDWSARIAAAAPFDFPALAKQILAQKSSVPRDRALAALISAWIKRNPQGLRAFLDTLDVDDTDGIGVTFFSALAQALPYVSDEAASSPYMSELVSELVETRAEEDPAAVLAWAEEWLLDDALEKARVTVAGALAAETPEEALKQLAKIKNPLRRVQALSAISEGYAQNDPKAARAWAEKLPHDAEVATAMNGILCVMAGQDPQSAAKTFAAVHSQIAGKYAKNAAAARRARGLPENPPLDEQGNPIIADAGGEDAVPVESPDLDMLGDASETIARDLALSDPAAALKWADSLPGVLQAAGRRAALTTWAETQPEAAYRYCVDNRLIDAGTFAGIFDSWGEQAPQAAAAAATGVASNLLRGEAISNAVGAWAAQEKDPAVVGDWISRLPGERERNIANRALASALDADQPQFAWDRVLQITNPDDRREVLSSAFASLVANQPKLAAAALDRASNLTQEERRRLARMLDTKSF